MRNFSEGERPSMQAQATGIHEITFVDLGISAETGQREGRLEFNPNSTDGPKRSRALDRAYRGGSRIRFK